MASSGFWGASSPGVGGRWTRSAQASVTEGARGGMTPVIKFIFERSLRSGKLPFGWVAAGVVRVFRRRDRSSAADYRPISLTCILCRVLEHILASNIVKHVDARGIMYDLNMVSGRKDPVKHSWS